MIYATTPCIFMQGTLDGERRYSSTAVGFPIRNDLSPHSHRVCRGFPSWERARVRATYVKDLSLARCYPMSPLYYAHRLTADSLAIYVPTPRQHHDLTSYSTRQPIAIPLQNYRESFGIRLGVTCRRTTQMKCTFSVRSRYVSSSTMLQTDQQSN